MKGSGAVFRRDAFSFANGDRIEGRYQIRQLLGRGGFGAVYAAVHLGTGQPVAIKMLVPAHGDAELGQLHQERFLREARTTASLQHPHTVRVFDVGQVEGGGPLYLVMELLRGPTLEAVLTRLEERGRVMSEVAAIAIAAPILGSLAEAHGRGLVHRDLKPANIILADISGNEPIVKVLDFGCSLTQGSELTGDGTILGTPGYMAPEQAHDEEVDARADLYSLGVILFRALCGRLPFQARDPLTLLYQHAHDPLPDPLQLTGGRLTPEIAAVVQRALAKAAGDRYEHAGAMRAALEALRPVASPWVRHAAGTTRIEPAGVAAPERGPLAALLATADEPADSADTAATASGREGDAARAPAAEPVAAREGAVAAVAPAPASTAEEAVPTASGDLAHTPALRRRWVWGAAVALGGAALAAWALGAGGGGGAGAPASTAAGAPVSPPAAAALGRTVAAPVRPTPAPVPTEPPAAGADASGVAGPKPTLAGDHAPTPAPPAPSVAPAAPEVASPAPDAGPVPSAASHRALPHRARRGYAGPKGATPQAPEPQPRSRLPAVIYDE